MGDFAYLQDPVLESGLADERQAGEAEIIYMSKTRLLHLS
jgi:hypothetical protein